MELEKIYHLLASIDRLDVFGAYVAHINGWDAHPGYASERAAEVAQILKTMPTVVLPPAEGANVEICPPKKRERRSVAFTPPIVEDVSTYIEEGGYAVDADEFCDFYTAKGWRIGSHVMKDWRAAVRMWSKRARVSGATGQKEKVYKEQLELNF